MSAPVGIRVLRWTVIVAVVAAVVGGLTIAGPPEQERKRQRDERRRNDLEMVANRMDERWNRTHALPPTLDALVETGDRFSSPIPRDPETDAPYEFTAIDSVTYSLCALFETDSRAARRRATRNLRAAGGGEGTFWDHPAGRHCFTIRISERVLQPPRPE